jgi:hypothetical protein
MVRQSAACRKGQQILALIKALDDFPNTRLLLVLTDTTSTQGEFTVSMLTNGAAQAAAQSPAAFIMTVDLACDSAVHKLCTG